MRAFYNYLDFSTFIFSLCIMRFKLPTSAGFALEKNGTQLSFEAKRKKLGLMLNKIIKYTNTQLY